MAWDEIQGNGSNHEDREFLSAKIGATFEGVFRNLGPATPSKYNDGNYRVLAIDLVDGRKAAVRAGKILLERLEAAGLTDGDKVRIVVESATSKGGREYANPRVYVDRSGLKAPQQASPAAKADDDEPPF